MAPANPSAPSVTTLSDVHNLFSASVHVDDQPVPVYKVEHTSSTKTTCYVEAQEGKEFKVEFVNKAHSGTSIAAFLRLDGQDSGGYTIQEHHKRAVFDSKRVSASAVRPFMFSKLNLTDDADLATTDEKTVKNLGTIQIELYRVTVLGDEYAREIFKETKEHVFDERSKKATLSHQAGYGAAKTNIDSGKRVRCQYIDPYGVTPYKVLEFKYRSRALLELDGIIEGEPAVEASPPPALLPAASSSSSNRKRQVLSLSDDDDDESDVRAKKVKPEPGVKREPVAGGSNVKKERIVIDLLDDSD